MSAPPVYPDWPPDPDRFSRPPDAAPLLDATPLFELQRALSTAWSAIDREIAVAGAGGDVAGAVERWRGLYRQWCALTRDRGYWGA